MLSVTIVTLLITSNVIPRIQAAEEQEQQKAQLNGMQTPVYEGGSVIETQKVQKIDTLNIVPESYVEQTNHADESQSSIKLQHNLNFDNILKDFDNKWSFFDAPSNRTGEVNYIGSRVYQRNISYPEIDGQNTLYGSQDVLIDNVFSNNPNGTNVYGPILVQENITYRGKNENSQYGASITQIDGNRRRDSNFDNSKKEFMKDEMKKPFNNISNRTGPGISYSVQTYQKNKPNFKGDFKGRNIVSGSLVKSIGNTFYNSDPNASVVVQIGNTYSENPENKTLLGIINNQSNNTYPRSIDTNKDALKPVIHQSENFYPSSNDSESKMKTKNNTENQVNTAEQNTTDSQGNSSSTNYDSSSHIENKTVYNKESEAYANNHTTFNRQMSFSSNAFYSLSYSLIILLQHSLF